MPSQLASLTALVVVLAVSCSDSKTEQPRRDSGMPIVAATTPGSKTDCLTTGLWAQCSVLERLVRAGLTVAEDSLTTIHDPVLSIDGKRLPIARGEIAMFIYADTGSRARDQAKLDKKSFISPDAQPTILRERTLIANQNLLVLMNVANETHRERIANALMAGPPQPPRHVP